MSNKHFDKEFKLPNPLHRTDNPTSNNELSKPLWSTNTWIVDHYNQFMHTRSGNVHSINTNANTKLSSRVHWKYYAKQIIDLFRSVFHANLVGLGDNFEYMCNDGDKYKQPDFSDFPHKPNESEFNHQQTNKRNNVGCPTCGHATKSKCWCKYPISRHNNKQRNDIKQHNNEQHKLNDSHNVTSLYYSVKRAKKHTDDSTER